MYGAFFCSERPLHGKASVRDIYRQEVFRPPPRLVVHAELSLGSFQTCSSAVRSPISIGRPVSCCVFRRNAVLQQFSLVFRRNFFAAFLRVLRRNEVLRSVLMCFAAASRGLFREFHRNVFLRLKVILSFLFRRNFAVLFVCSTAPRLAVFFFVSRRPSLPS